MEGERKNNTALLTVIAIATLLVAVVGATFAYFSASQDTTGGNVTVNATTAAANDIFTANGSGNITLSITADKMLQTNAGQVADHDNSSSITVELTAGSSYASCTYDIVYTPGTAFTCSANHAAEYVLDGTCTSDDTSLAPCASKNFTNEDLKGSSAVTVVTGAKIVDQYDSNDTATSQSWAFDAKFLNLNTDQGAHIDTTFGGTLSVENVQCTNTATAPSGS